MKKFIKIAIIFYILNSCSKETENYITIKGEVIRELNNEGIGNQKILLKMIKTFNTGYHYTTEIDSKIIYTDNNGKFTVNMKSDSNTHITAFKYQDDDFEQYGLSEEIPNNIFQTNSDIIIKVNKLIKFKIYVEHTNPFDNNDFVKIDFFAGNKQSYRTKIENFGVQNTYFPIEYLPGGGSFGAHEDASWTGTNVNSIIYYSVAENADQFKIQWKLRKNSIETTGFTSDLTSYINQVNEFHYNY